MNQNDPPTPPTSAKIAQALVDRRQRTVRAEHVILERRDDGRTVVTVDGQELILPTSARVNQTFQHNKPRPMVTITIQAKRIQILTSTIGIEGTDQ